MFHIDDVLQLEDREQVRAIARRHLVTILPSLFLSLLLIVTPFFAMYPLFQWGWPGIVVFFVLILTGIIVAIRSLLLWDADVFIVTSVRVVDVDQSGLLTRSVSEAALSTIQDVSWARNGFLETVFRMGTLHIQSPGVRIEAAKISSPHHVADMIQGLRGTRTVPVVEDVRVVSEDAEEERTDASEEVSMDVREVKIQRITKLLQGYTSDELDRIESVLRTRVQTEREEREESTDEVETA